MEYQKETITPLQKVTSEALNHNEQAYKIVYYEKTDKFMDKIAVYFLWKPRNNPEKDYAKRSTYFLAPEQFLIFINNQIKDYFFFREKRLQLPKKMDISDFRITMLEMFIKQLKENQLNVWKNNKK